MQNLKRTATASFRVEPEIKKDAEKLFANLGLTLSDAINIFLRKSINENGIPFGVTADPFYSESNLKWIKESIAQMENGKGVVYNDVSEILAERV